MGVAVGFLHGDTYPDMILGNYAGGMAFFEGIMETPVNLNEAETQSLIKCYPNPASDIVNIETTHNGKKQVQIFDMIGRKIMETSFSDTHFQLNISNLSPSVYLMKLISEEQTHLFKIIKK